MLILDCESEIDYLNYDAISQTVVKLLKADRKHPFTVGIHGDWGAGKSSILKMIETELSSDENVVVLWFNGWTFEGFDDAKTVLIESTITELCRKRSNFGKVKEKASDLLKKINWLKLIKRSSGVAFNFLTGLPSPDQIETAGRKLRTLGQDAADFDVSEMPEKLEEIAEFLKPVENHSNLSETIHEFREEFQDLLNEAKIEQLIVLIDDLDRCLPATAIQTLEAIRLFLFVPKSAFVIGADEAMIEYAVRQHFPDLSVVSEPLTYTRNYLEKLIQVPFRIPALGTQETRVYVTLLLVHNIVGENHDGFSKLLTEAKDSLKQPWHGVNLSLRDVQKVDVSAKDKLNSAYMLAQQIAPILAEGTKGNPRQIKRFLNALLIRQCIAEARGFGQHIKQPVLAKLMLAERFQQDFYDHMSAQAMSAADGKGSALAVLENGQSEQLKKKRKSPSNKDGKKDAMTHQQTETSKWLDSEWLKNWSQIEPKLAPEDLRPYVFVARDKRLLVSVTEQSRLETLISELCGNKIQIRQAESEVKELSTADAGIVFRGLHERVVRAGQFKTAPQGIYGLAIVAKHHSRLQAELAALLETFDPKQLGPWAVKGWNESITEPQAKSKLIEVLRKWADQDQNKTLSSAAQNAVTTLEHRKR